MSHTLKTLEKSEAELTITVPPEDYKKEMDKAAIRLSERAAIKGFRPGKAPYDEVKTQLGEAKILEEALQDIIQKHYYEAIKAEDLKPIGMPEISMEKIAPANDVVFRARIALLPSIKLSDISKIKSTIKPAVIGDKEIDKVITDIRKMQIKETVKDNVATKEDKLVVDLDMFIDKVAIEGGQAKDHQIYLNEDHYVPGLSEKLIGLKKDDEKEFPLSFPKDHYQKNLAGKNVDVTVKVKEVFALDMPEITDEIAKTLGQPNIAGLRKLLKENLTKEAARKDSQKIEAEILEQLIKNSTFGDLPEVLKKSEKNKMFHELKHDLEQRSIEIEQYLKDIKKTEEQIFDDFENGAVDRVKAALISRQIAEDFNITVSKEDMDTELGLIRATYKDDPKVEENLKRNDVLETIAGAVQNRKVMVLLREKVLGIKNTDETKTKVETTEKDKK